MVADGDRAVGAPDAHVGVEAPGVVALGDVAEVALEAAVMGRVDDLLVEVARPRVGAGRGQAEAVALRQREQPGAVLALERCRIGEGLAAARADLDLGGDQLAGGRDGEHLVLLGRVIELLEAVLELERLGVDDRELLFEPDREVG